MAKKEYKILSPTAILGYGFPAESFQRGIEENPDLIAVDAGSTDPGPYYLGAGKAFTDRLGVKSDLRAMLVNGIKKNIPIVIGTAGGSGARPHVDWCRAIIEEIAKEENLKFRMGVVYADVDVEEVVKGIKEGALLPLDDQPVPTEEEVRQCPYIVAQMGPEPLQKMISKGCQVILGGRCYDPSCFSARPIAEGYDRALATHLGKILECAAIAATPGSGSDSVIGILKEDSFILQALSPERKFTAQSTAAHTLYEKSDPFHLPGPGGSLDLTNVTFTELGDGRVEVRGTKFVPTPKYQVKLEGSRCVGYRTISVCGTHDPILISKIDEVCQQVKDRVEHLLERENAQGKSKVFFHIYGKNGVMGDLEHGDYPLPHELGIVMEVLADTQEQANTVCSITRSTFLHYGYEGRISTAGNLAFPFSPSDTPMGPCYEFCLYHLLDVDDPTALFSDEVFDIDGDKVKRVED
ncbi:acyclic terpene utilization AtuA family protein [bacterium]|nr:acyclic terpene utilization AtuA family protein [bacterium]